MTMTFADVRLGLRAYLLGSPEIASMVGGERVFPIRLPQGVKKNSIVFSRATGSGDHHLQGVSGLSRPRFQIDSWSQTESESTVLANYVKARLDGFRGHMEYGSNSPRDFIDVLGVFYSDEREDFDADSQLFRMSRDYFVWYRDYITGGVM